MGHNQATCGKYNKWHGRCFCGLVVFSEHHHSLAIQLEKMAQRSQRNLLVKFTAYFCFIFSCLGNIPQAELVPAILTLTRPEHNGVVPPTFDFGFEIKVDGDSKLFTKQYAKAKICISLDHQEVADCFDMSINALGARDLFIGNHVVEVWLQHENGEPIIPPKLTTFEVRERNEYKKWLKYGGSHIANETYLNEIMQEKKMVGPTLKTWYFGNTAATNQHQHRHPLNSSPISSAGWTCSQTDRNKPIDFVIGIKTSAYGFIDRQALRKTWLSQINKDSQVCVW
jgi:hypothetical protein